jgi:hypothetical protein
VRFRRFLSGCRDKLDQQPVLLNHAEFMAILTYDISMTAQFPGCVCLLHEMAAVTELGVLLDIIIVPDAQHDPEH